MFASHTNPIAGWKILFSRNYDNLNPAIKDDYNAYIKALPSDERNGVGPIQFFEDGTGQHAVSITMYVNGTDWCHVLIYDKDNKRIKIYKYISGHARS